MYICTWFQQKREGEGRWNKRRRVQGGGGFKYIIHREMITMLWQWILAWLLSLRLFHICNCEAPRAPAAQHTDKFSWTVVNSVKLCTWLTVVYLPRSPTTVVDCERLLKSKILNIRTFLIESKREREREKTVVEHWSVAGRNTSFSIRTTWNCRNDLHLLYC